VLSIVIPTLDAAATLPDTIAALGSLSDHELIVVDGGSRDETATIATATGALLIAAARGRGTQLAAGAAAARGAWFLFLHADTRLAPGWSDDVQRHMAADEFRAAYFRFALDDASGAARRVERLVRWRCRAFALPYGDQGLLVSRRLYDEVGGYRPMPLMEDVDLIRRIGRRRLVELPSAALTSAARYRRDGWWLRPMRNLGILALWHLGAPPEFLRRIYR
jgi:rSAM/selenodomain-associated transferase 2